MEMEDEQNKEEISEEEPEALSSSSSSSSFVEDNYGHRLSAADPLLLEISELFAREKDVKQMGKRLLGKRGLEMFESSPFDPKVNNFWPKLAHKMMCLWCRLRKAADEDDRRGNDLFGLLTELRRDDLLADYWVKLGASERESSSEEMDDENEAEEESDSDDDITPPAKRQKSDHEVWVPPPLMPYLTWHCMKMIAACFGDDFAKAKDMAEVMLDRGNELLLHRLATKPGQTTEKYVLEVLDVYRRQHGNGADCVSLLRLALKAEFKMPEAADCLLLT